MKKILSFSLLIVLALSLKVGNITVKANELDVRAQEAEQNEFSVMSETETEEVHEVNNEDCTEGVISKEVPGLTKEGFAENDEWHVDESKAASVDRKSESKDDSENVTEKSIKTDAVDVKAVSVKSSDIEASTTKSQSDIQEEQENVNLEDPTVTAVPTTTTMPIIGVRPDQDEISEVEQEIEEDDIANSDVKVEPTKKKAVAIKNATVETTSEGKDEVVETNKEEGTTTVVSEDSVPSSATLPQTGVMSEYVFYVLGGLMCILGICVLAISKKNSVQQ